MGFLRDDYILLMSSEEIYDQLTGGQVNMIFDKIRETKIPFPDHYKFSSNNVEYRKEEYGHLDVNFIALVKNE